MNYAFFKGEFVPLEEAKIGILTHSFHYGTACFEGIRGHWNKEKGQLYLFRLREHYERLMEGCKLLKMELPYTIDELCDITVELIRESNIKEDLYVRPIAYKSSEALGVRLHDLECDIAITVIPFAPYLDFEKGVRCCVSSWRRVSDDMIPPRGKITGIYINSALAKTEAIERGFDEAILLTEDGHVAEGSGENIFLVKDGKIITPPIYESILVGVTRNTIMELSREELGIEVVERRVDRYELYIADECFFTGTAAYVTPIVEIDGRKIGDGKMGPITRKLQEIYLDVVYGKVDKYMKWCLPVYPEEKR